MIKLIISGCNGKMGKVVSSIVLNQPDIEVVAGFDINTETAFGYPVYKTPAECPEKADVIIDFSHPDLLESLLDYAVSTGTPLVECTTGLTDAQKEKMLEASSKVPVFFSANMSLGVNLLIELAQRATKLLADAFDIEIIEKHHNQKIDAPSGTALAIADGINDVLSERKEYVYDRHAVRKKRTQKEIGIHAIRGGTIVGEHSVIFAGKDEVVELKHEAHSKEIFAVGAVAAAKFVTGKPAKMYNMQDLVAEM
ncbi:MAG: 4-hydroxy-tetrahydrodipicolinate reductase [Clostridia bacterium]|nr:4-hydroxy-tetrahydrodipicolinate reductase [Clostridia bacterium]